MNTVGDARRTVRAAVAAALVLAALPAPAWAGDKGPSSFPASLPPSVMAGGSVQTVHFGNPRQAPVKLLRGPPGPGSGSYVRREVVSFGDGTARQVTIVRGPLEPAAAAPPRQAALVPRERIERVSFGDPAQPIVTVVRGGAGLREAAYSIDLFGPADAGELDRIAFAVHGVESSHGTNPAMWRPSLSGPQGPMQVSAAAALDVGGGDRFDIDDNKRLGRAYLAQMYRRYGNWPDAIAAYNWGPGNVDQWIARGRDPDRLPLETTRYLERVLRDALITRTAARF